jgi:hypothetical protein
MWREVIFMATMLNLEEILPDAGAIELPDGIRLFCGECGQPTRDYGQHAIAKLVQGAISGTIKLMADCEMCGKYTSCSLIGKKDSEFAVYVPDDDAEHDLIN